MGARENQIIRVILQSLDKMGDELCAEPVLQASVALLVPPPLLVSQFDAALRSAEAERWIIGVRPKLGTTKWSLTDKGRAVLLEN